jgi:hypothetical protein
MDHVTRRTVYWRTRSASICPCMIDALEFGVNQCADVQVYPSEI